MYSTFHFAGGVMTAYLVCSMHLIRNIYSLAAGNIPAVVWGLLCEGRDSMRTDQKVYYQVQAVYKKTTALLQKDAAKEVVNG